jgi:predicted dehydrogenase
VIGVVGAGEIVTSAHLPIYARRGWTVSAIYDQDITQAQRVAAEWGTHSFTSLDGILQNADVAIVDIAVPPEHQPAIVKAALRAGKHVLAQKPLARTLQEARALVELAEQEGRLLAVNQQMRWSPVAQAFQDGIRSHRVGRVHYLEFDLNLSLVGLNPESWFARESHPVTLLNSIHFLDLARYLFGEPESVRAITMRCDPQLPLSGEQGAIIVLEMPNGPTVVIADRRNARGHHEATFLLIGVNGAIRGQLGLWTNYPIGTDDVVEYRASDAASWTALPVQGRWIPDAFAGPMGELIEAIKGGREPSNSGADHLKTLALVHSVWKSAADEMGRQTAKSEQQ